MSGRAGGEAIYLLAEFAYVGALCQWGGACAVERV